MGEGLGVGGVLRVWPSRGLLTGGGPLQMCHFPDLLGRLVSTSLFYFKSSWEDVRAAAPMLTGECLPLCPFTRACRSP